MKKKPTLESLVAGIPLASVTAKSKRINVNVTPQEHAEIHETARALGLSVTDLILRTVALVAARLRLERR